MTAQEISKAEKLLSRRIRTGDDSRETPPDNSGERLCHTVSCLANGEHQYLAERSQLVVMVPDAKPSLLVLQVTRERSRDAALPQGVFEHLTSVLPHFGKRRR
jgi:hypothetical protein